ncbi:MAG: protein translocase subunit SecD [Lachnospiraceae bacterium]|nr:protein translocase subunit SecD [Lachnospiraceae bacterium]
MNKKKGIISLVVFLALLVLFVYTAAFGWGETKSGSAYSVPLGLDLAGGVSITYQAVGDTPSAEDMSDTIYKLQRRVENYSTEAQVYQEGDNRINVEIPGVNDAEKILSELGQPGTLYFIRQTDDEGNENYTSGAGGYTLSRTLDEIIETGDAVLSGTDVANAQGSYQQDNMGNQSPVVQLTFTDEGAKKFADATTKAYENGETIGIYYDGEFVSVPTVNAAITDGKAIIEGMEDITAAQQLAQTIRIGGLKVQLEEIHSKVVGAQLGQDAIQTSLIAGLVGFILIVVMMIAVYRLMGFAASLALTMYIALEVILLDAFELTLTLSGVAGIILSIGMAVDANVIVFARIREELRAGRSLKGAIDSGYHRALSAIIDGNVTTLIAAAVLGLRGSGSVKGFAQTLALGIIISMFTALFVTRIIMSAFYGLGLQDVKLYGTAKEPKKRGFIAKSKLCIGISCALIAAGIVVMIVNSASGKKAFNYSLEFVGGTSTTVNTPEDMSLEDINREIVPLFQEVTGDADVQIQKVAGSNEVIIKTRRLESAERSAVDEKLVEALGIESTAITAESISSTISNEMRTDAVIAVIITCICILIYIWLRFKDLRFASGSVAALVHDVLIVMSFYAVVRMSVGSTFVACILTLVGYSINDTIVVFDRIRENLVGAGDRRDLQEITDTSNSQTLSRSIFTSLTTFFMVMSLFIFGTSSVKEFALPLMIGIVCGTYSSIEIAPSIWYYLRTAADKKAAEKKAAEKAEKKKRK